MISRLLAVLVAWLAFTPVAQGASFISPTGNDANFCTSADPCLSIARGVATTTDATVQALPGSYGSVSVLGVKPAAQTTVTGKGATFGAVDMRNSARLTLEGIKFTGLFRMQTTSGTSGPVSDVKLLHDEFTGGCVQAFNKATNITLQASVLHDCTTGFTAPRRPWSGGVPNKFALASSGFTITENTFQTMVADAIQLGNVDNVTVTNNSFAELNDPANVQHNDCVQLTGDNHNVDMVNNTCDRSTQGLFAQTYRDSNPASPGYGQNYTIDDVLMEDNTIGHVEAVGIRLEGVTNGVLRHNVICNAKDGGIFLYPSSQGGAYATDTIVDGAFVSGSIPYKEQAPAASASKVNVIGC